MSRVLIADDDRISCKLLSSLLTKWGYQAETVHNGLDAQRELLKPDGPQLAILDWVMPGLDGIQVIRTLRATPRKSYTYILLLTSKGAKADVLAGLDAGADDYLKKPYDTRELRARLGVGARILGLETQLASALETTEYRGTHDSLTGLYTRKAIIELLHQTVLHCEGEGRRVSLLLVDIDHLKTINETYGQSAGDMVIKQLAPKMASPLRPHDSVGRFGGEQYLIVAPNCPINHAMVVAVRLCQTVAREKFLIEKFAVQVTVSIGVSSIRRSVLDVNQVLQEADSALREAKSKGRNRAVCSNPSESAGQSSADSKLGASARKTLTLAPL
jgi:two-component system cell cycle response regulator